MQLSLNEARLVRGLRQVLKPPTKLTLTEWADTYRVLSAESSASAGQYNSGRTPYMREIMDCVSDTDVEEVTFIASAQTAKTTLIENICGFFIDQEPAPLLVIQPTLEMAETFSKDRLAPMLRDTPALRGKVKDARARDSGNTMLHKSYPGGQITMAGANSPASLASRPKRVVLFDEVDRYNTTAGTEGDPVDLGKARTTTFHNKKLIYVSTPGNAAMHGQEATRGTSRIFPSFESGDQRYFMLACPHCGERQRLMWRQVKWHEGQPETAAYVCEHCAALITDTEKMAMLQTGVWQATKQFKGHASFHISALYSPFVTFAEMVKKFLEAKSQKERLKVFVNTMLAELWEDVQGEGETWEKLYARCQPYKPFTVPAAARMLTMGVDVQRTGRLAVVIRAWGPGSESWLIYHDEIYGDVLLPEVWQQIDNLIDTQFEQEGTSETMSILVTAVDIGDGVNMHVVGGYCWQRRHKRVIAIRGSSKPGIPIQGKQFDFSYDHRGHKIPGAKGWYVGTDTAKSLIYARLTSKEGPGSYHWYIGTDPEYFQQLTAEKKVTKFYKGFPKTEWVKTRPRNEALDCEVYALMAAHYAGIERAKWGRLQSVAPARTMTVAQDTVDETEANESEPDQEPIATTPPPEVRRERRPDRGRAGGGWVNGWRRF